MTNRMEAAAQLQDELGDLTLRIGAVLGADLTLLLDERIRSRAAQLVAEITDGEHPDATASDVLALLWPESPPLEWWRTPLGVALAPTLAAQATDDDGWSHDQAATVLGVSRGTVAQLVHRGSIERTPGGACSQRSVLTRLVRLASERS